MKSLKLPLEEAVKAAAKQNLELDILVGLVDEDEFESLLPEYEEEARYLLEDTLARTINQSIRITILFQ